MKHNVSANTAVVLRATNDFFLPKREAAQWSDNYNPFQKMEPSLFAVLAAVRARYH
jgi:hypothetical protein